MNLLDGAIVLVLVAAAVHGARRGAAVQMLTLVGFIGGLALGVALVLAIAPKLSGQVAKTAAAVILLLVPASLLAGAGRQVGMRVSRHLRRWRAGWADAAGGSVLAVLGTLVVCWLFASVLIGSSVTAISQQIDQSRIMRAVQQWMPPVPDAFAAVQRYLSSSGFPQVLVNVLPEPIGPVNLPTVAQVDRVEQLVDASTVKVTALGCGNHELEGSGFAATGDLVVTNAHVVAGTNDIHVELPDGSVVPARPVLFDGEFDLAVLRTAPLGVRPLPIDPGYVERGSPAVVLGYPGGGPLEVGGAGVVSRFVAEGRDIYDSALVSRAVYGLQAVVRPGNSGGPLVSTSGQVIGVVFSRSASQPERGYALASPGVLRRLRTVSDASPPVGTLACVSGA